MSEDFDEKAATWDEDPERVRRAAHVAEIIARRVPLAPDMHVLDFGCGTGLLGFALLDRVSAVTFADPAEGMRRRVEEKLRAGRHGRGTVHRLDPRALALPQNYDVIVSLMALHHVADPPAVLELLARHLVPGGWLALCDLDVEDGSFHDDPAAEVHHGFDRSVVTDTLRRVGLVDARIETAYTIRVVRADATRVYPLFLVTARLPVSSGASALPESGSARTATSAGS